MARLSGLVEISIAAVQFIVSRDARLHMALEPNLGHLSNFAPPTMTVPRPYKISVPDSELNALKVKLELTTLPDELESAGWQYGVPLAEVKRLVKYWINGYDWRTQEKAINDSLPQFTRDIYVEGFGTLNIHFIHERSAEESAIPLLFIHGCGCTNRT